MMKEQRRSPRYRHEIVVEVHDKRGVRRLHAVDVARHGIFVVTDDPPRERHLVQLTIHLPSGAIRAAASVTRTLTQTATGQEPGAGLQFFALSDEDKERWDEFIFYLHRTTPPRGVSRPPLDAANDASGAREEPKRTELTRAEGSSGATFLVKLKTVDRLQDFAQTHLAAGGTMLFTPVLRAPGESVTLVVVHPKTDEEFKLPGVIAKAHQDRPKRLEIHFLGVNAQLMNAFRAYVESGRPPTMEVQAGFAPTVVPQPAGTQTPLLPEQKDFDLDVDVFDEDTLDTDDRLAQMPGPLTVGAPVRAGGAGGASIGGAPTGKAVDPGLGPHAYVLRCASCSAEPYTVDLGPCRGVLGLVADHQPLLGRTGLVVSVPRLVGREERTQRVQAFLQRGGHLNAVVDVMTLLGAVSLAEAAVDPADGSPLKSSRAIERLDAAAQKLGDKSPAAATKVKCASCKVGTLTVERRTS